ncbi:uncharacterized protein ACRADG_008661 isoform 1-T1 [Cochliomyia hominivorax]
MPRYREWDLACKVYVGNLGSSASKYEIENAFSKYGPLRNVWVARNPPGFAFVEFEDRRDAEDATRGLDGTRCCGTRIRVEMSSGRSRRDNRRRGGTSSGGRGGGGESSSGGRGGGGRYRIKTTSASTTSTRTTSTSTTTTTNSSSYYFYNKPINNFNNNDYNFYYYYYHCYKNRNNFTKTIIPLIITTNTLINNKNNTKQHTQHNSNNYTNTKTLGYFKINSIHNFYNLIRNYIIYLLKFLIINQLINVYKHHHKSNHIHLRLMFS